MLQLNSLRKRFILVLHTCRLTKKCIKIYNDCRAIVQLIKPFGCCWGLYKVTVSALFASIFAISTLKSLTNSKLTQVQLIIFHSQPKNSVPFAPGNGWYTGIFGWKENTLKIRFNEQHNDSTCTLKYYGTYHCCSLQHDIHVVNCPNSA